ncbi:MAG: DUF533 domain-containing protein [Verrucomicrobiota bacterium]
MPFQKLFDDFAGNVSPVGDLLLNPGAKGGTSGALVSLLMNKNARQKITKAALPVGGAAALAGVGYLAYRQWQNKQDPATPPPPPPVSSTSPADMPPPPPDMPPPPPPNLEVASAEVSISDSLPEKMILAMISAASADGEISNDEMGELLSAIEETPLLPEEKSQLTSVLNQPPTVEEIAAMSEGPEEASQLYGAALSAIEVDTPAEHLFLRRFANALELEPSLVEAIHEASNA